MSDASIDPTTPGRRRTLWIVAALNVAIALGFLLTGLLGDSSALIANALDNASDAIVYVLSLVALGRGHDWKVNAARFSGVMLLVFAVGVLVDVGRRALYGSEPIGGAMMAMATVAAVVNIACYLLLKRLENKDVNLRAATTFSLNDFAANGGIIVGGALVWWTGSRWPDLVVGVAVAAIAAWGGLEILRDAREESRGGGEHGRADA